MSNNPTHVHLSFLGLPPPTRTPPDPPAYDDRSDWLAVVGTLLEAFQLLRGLAVHSVGGAAVSKRSRSPRVGDLVYVSLTFERTPERSLGWLREIEAGAGAAGTDRYLIDPIGAQPPLWWENCSIDAIPAGDPYSRWLDDIEKLFRPAPKGRTE